MKSQWKARKTVAMYEQDMQGVGLSGSLINGH